VKGKRQYIEVYEIFDGDPMPLFSLKQQTKSCFEEGMQAYYRQDFAHAVTAMQTVLTQLPSDKAAQICLEKAEEFSYYPPSLDWDGVTHMEM
jgi:hypothetical protein